MTVCPDCGRVPLAAPRGSRFAVQCVCGFRDGEARTGAERWMDEQLKDPEYRFAYEDARERIARFDRVWWRVYGCMMGTALSLLTFLVACHARGWTGVWLRVVALLLAVWFLMARRLSRWATRRIVGDA